MSRVTLAAGAATIAGLAIAAARPANLEAQLVTATGCGEREIEQILASGADRAAAALRPFVTDPPEHPEMARAIAADPGAIDAIRALYAGLDPVETAPDQGEAA